MYLGYLAVHIMHFIQVREKDSIIFILTSIIKMHLRSERDFSWKSSREQERGPVWEGSGGESYSICNATAGQKVFLVPTQAKCLKALLDVGVGLDELRVRLAE